MAKRTELLERANQLLEKTPDDSVEALNFWQGYVIALEQLGQE